MRNYKQNIAAQLTALSGAVPSMSGADLFTGILDTCIGLVSVLAGNFGEAGLDADGLGDLTSCLEGLQLQINKLANTAADADCLRVDGHAVDELAALQAKAQDLLSREQQAQAKLPALQQDIQELEPAVQQLEADYCQQEVLHAALLKKAQEYSEQKYNALKAQNDRLIDRIHKDAADFKKLKDLVQQHQDELDGLQAQINGMPTEQQLVADYDKKAAELARLQQAQVECSLAKQSELDNRISALEKDVGLLEGAMTVLRAREQDILSSKARIETEKGVFETDFLDKLQSAMDDLKNNMVTHRKTLNRLKADAEDLWKSIDECNSIRLNYSFMFDSLNDPLAAIANAAEMDHEALKKYLDINVSARVEELKGSIRQDLGELGRIIDRCREASASDQEALRSKIFQTG